MEQRPVNGNDNGRFFGRQTVSAPNRATFLALSLAFIISTCVRTNWALCYVRKLAMC